MNRANVGIIPPDQITDPNDVEIHASIELRRQTPGVEPYYIGHVRVDANGIPIDQDLSLPSAKNTTMYGDVVNRPYDTERTIAEITAVGIDDKYRGKGIGSRLYKAFARMAILHGGATHLSGEPSADALRTRDRIFGVENSEFVVVRTKLIDGDFLNGRIAASYEVVDPAEARSWILDDGAAPDKQLLDEYRGSLRLKYGTTFLGDVMNDDERQHLKQLSARPSLLNRYVITDMRGCDVSDWAADLEVVVSR